MVRYHGGGLSSGVAASRPWAVLALCEREPRRRGGSTNLDVRAVLIFGARGLNWGLIHPCSDRFGSDSQNLLTCGFVPSRTPLNGVA
jgi:hypothetical protein